MALGLKTLAARMGFGGEGPLPVKSEDAYRDWMRERLARQLKVDPAVIDVQAPFDTYGIDSRVALQMSGELERLSGRRLSPALLFEYPTIDAIAKVLAAEAPEPSRK